jgi:hypothetical protein
VPGIASQDRRWEVVAAFAFGCTFLTIILTIVFFKPNPTAFEYTVFRIVIALAAAGVGAIIPGFLDIKFKTWLRAGGALALFVIVYFFAPVATTSGEASLGPGPKSDAKMSAEAWLSLLDERKFSGAYSSMADLFKSRYKFPEFEQLLSRERNSLGRLKNRQLLSTAPYESPPGAPKGVYRQYVYKALFENEPQGIYEVVWLIGERDSWRVLSVYTSVKTPSGQFIPYEPK